MYIIPDDSTSFWTMIIAVFTIVMVFVAIFSVYFVRGQLELNRKTLMNDVLSNYKEEWNTLSLRTARIVVCYRFLTEGSKEDIINVGDDIQCFLNTENIDAYNANDLVLDFFERLCGYIMSGVLSEEVAYDPFSYILEGFYHILLDYMERIKKEDATLYRNIGHVFESFSEKSKKMSKNRKYEIDYCRFCLEQIGKNSLELKLNGIMIET